ncbi:hypothetical protein DSECCO2_639930 [anaerobic digester metagenome]
MRKLVVERVEEGPLALVSVASLLDAVAELCIGPASRRVELIRLDPPAEADKVEVRRPGPGMFFRAVMAAALAAVQVDLPPRVEYEYSTVAAAVFLEQRPGMGVGPVKPFPGREGGDCKERVVRPGG